MAFKICSFLPAFQKFCYWQTFKPASEVLLNILNRPFNQKYKHSFSCLKYCNPDNFYLVPLSCHCDESVPWMRVCLSEVISKVTMTSDIALKNHITYFQLLTHFLPPSQIYTKVCWIGVIFPTSSSWPLFWDANYNKNIVCYMCITETLMYTLTN